MADALCDRAQSGVKREWMGWIRYYWPEVVCVGVFPTRGEALEAAREARQAECEDVLSVFATPAALFPEGGA